MIRETDIVFDEILEDTDPGASMHLVTTYTSLEHTDFLASATQLVFQVVVDVLTTRDDVPLSITLEHSADGRNWKTKNAAPEVSGTIPRTAASISFTGGEQRPVTPSQRFARLCINAGGSIGPFAINVVVHAGARGRRSLDDPQKTEQRLPGDSTLFGFRREVVSEIETLMEAAAGMPHEDRYEYLARRLSRDAFAELNSFQLRVRSLDEAGRRALFHAAAATIGILTMPPLWRKQMTQPEEECRSCDPAEAGEKAGGSCGRDCESESGGETSRSRETRVEEARLAEHVSQQESEIGDGAEDDEARPDARGRRTPVQLRVAGEDVGDDFDPVDDTRRPRSPEHTGMTPANMRLPGEDDLDPPADFAEAPPETPDTERASS